MSTASLPTKVATTNRTIDLRVSGFVACSHSALQNGDTKEAKHYATLAKIAASR